ncbi:MAG: A/G-specific adenine glycosylase [Pseudomonadota bacterium]
MPKTVFSTDLLSWYDENARALPWRVGPDARARGQSPEPYRVWLSEIMLQQTTVQTVAPRFQRFLTRWPDIAALALAETDDVLGEWAGLGYYARARNLHKCARVVASDYGGRFPDTEEELLKLPGVGAYTAAAIAAIAFDRKAIVVDGNIERVAARVFSIATPLKQAKAEIKAAMATLWPNKRSGDFAQALMDLGAGVCTPRAPSCLLCPVRAHCTAAHEGEPERFPVKPPKAAKPLRQGVAYALFNARGDILAERRPDDGLLGGMLGLPGTEWSEEKSPPCPPAPADWREAHAIRHTFTHFHLDLTVAIAQAPKGWRRSGAQSWVDPAEAPFPTVMRKAVDAACAARDAGLQPGVP